jgi:hypothetical protein
LVAPENKIETRKSPGKNQKPEIIQTPKYQVSTKDLTKVEKKEMPMKPWKNRKPGDKKDVTIEMFVPDLKPKV